MTSQVLSEQVSESVLAAWARLLRAHAATTRELSAQLQADHGLTIKGVTAPVELVGTIGDPFPHPSGTERLTLKLEGTIDRREFGIDWNMELPNGEQALSNDVSLVADLFLVKA